MAREGLSLADFKPILLEASKHPELVLVGGQAIALWAQKYHARITRLHAGWPYQLFLASLFPLGRRQQLFDGTIKVPAGLVGLLDASLVKLFVFHLGKFLGHLV